ncbi:MAG TPA: hypothetical protein VGC38_04105 [Pseudolabrys sp.]
MAYSSRRLPSRFPVGTKFIVEARQAAKGQVQVFKRSLEFPDGTHVRLPARAEKRKAVADTRRHRRARQAATESGPQL